MSDDWGGLDRDDDLSSYLEPSTPGVPTPVGPLVSPLELGKISRSPGASPPSRQETGGLRDRQGGDLRDRQRAPKAVRAPGLGAFGAFTPQAVCELKALSKLAYLFFVNTSAGATQNALATLGVFRYLYNGARATILPGFSPAIQAALPVSIPDVSWSAEMQRAIGFSLAGALGTSSPAIATVANLPGSMAAVATWFPTFQAALPPEDVMTIADYANQPTSGDYATAIGAIARDDLTACATPTTSPTPTSTPTPVTQYVPYPTAPTSTAYTAPYPRSSTGGGGSSSSITGSGSTVITIALLGLVGWGAYLAFRDGSKAKSDKLAGIDTSGLMAKARRAAALDAPKMRCLPTAEARTRVSMDETAGRRGEKLAEQLQDLPPKDALQIEEAYFSELDRIRPGAPRCIG